MAKGQQLQDPFLNACRKDRVPVDIFLVNGIKLSGKIDSFDQFVIIFSRADGGGTQMIYKHAVSTISPSRKVDYQPQKKTEPESSN